MRSERPKRSESPSATTCSDCVKSGEERVFGASQLRCDRGKIGASKTRVRPPMTAKVRTAAVPEALQDVALVDAPACAAAAGCGLSHWFNLVRRGGAPQPAIRRPRYTRWRLADIRAWLATVSGDDPTVIAQARYASHVAQAKRGGPRRRLGDLR
jgi:predicted DNA-binding transcriptional regulator AlpA